MNEVSKPQFTQLSFPGWTGEPTNENQDKPHPLIIAERWGFELHYDKQDGNPNHYLYHAVQWTQGLGAGDREAWTRLKKQLLVSNAQLKIRILPYLASNGKTYLVDFISHEACYLVAQAMRVTKSRPQLAEIKDYLAKAGVIIDNVRRGDPETTEWLKARLHGIEMRKRTVAIYRLTHYTYNPKFGVLTNVTYHRLFATTKRETAAKELRSALHLTKGQNIRDHIHTTGLISIDAAESLASEKMLLMGHRLNDAEQIKIVDKAAEIEARSLKEKCAWLEIDLITGKSLALVSDEEESDWE